jgi:hypothetical protein
MLRSLREHAERRDQLAPKAVDGQDYKWQHRIAALVHGWTLHEHHYADYPIVLSDEDYDKALSLAEAGSIAVHEPAMAKAPKMPEAPEPQGMAELGTVASPPMSEDDEPEAAESEVV